MYKKILISLITLLLLTSVSILSFATDENDGKDFVNDVRNVVGDTENTIEDAARDVSNTSKKATGNFENTMTNTDNNVSSTNNDDNYTAVRTGTNDAGEATLMGMNATTWTWVILAIAAVGIIALIWAFSSQSNDKNS